IARNESTSVSATGLAAAAPCACASVLGTSAKLTTRAPEPLMRSRRDGWMFMGPSPRSGDAGCALDGGDNAHVRPAAGVVVGEWLFDIGVAWLLVGGEQRGRFHHHAVDAVAALRRLRVDERLLHRMRALWRAEAFERDDLLLLRHARQRCDAGAHGLAVD